MTTQQHDAILTLVDTVSKMAYFVPTTSTVTTEGVLQLLAGRLVRYHGLAKVLLSDLDPRFTVEFWRLMCQRFDTKRALSSSRHQQTNGQRERLYRTPEQTLRTYIQYDESHWEDLLPAIELACNCTTHSSTGLSPFKVMVGEIPLRASDLDVVDAFEPTVSPTMAKLFQQLVRDNPRPPHMLQPTGWGPAEEPQHDSDPVYEVKHILDSRGSGADKGFLVQWRGYPVEEATWEADVFRVPRGQVAGTVEEGGGLQKG
ncbi:hypothetical protein Emed_002987 [Eimeria media]